MVSSEKNIILYPYTEHIGAFIIVLSWHLCSQPLPYYAIPALLVKLSYYAHYYASYLA